MERDNTPFAFIGNNIALDFVNTEIVSRGKLIDLLQRDDDLVRWAHDLQLALTPELNATDLSEAKKLRKALKEAYLAKINHTAIPKNALAGINQHLENYAKPVILVANKNELILEPRQETLSASMLFAHIAFEGASLLASPQSLRLKKCHNSECVLLFLDTSRNQQRRWCSMETCGNRAKASNHYKRSLS